MPGLLSGSVVHGQCTIVVGPNKHRLNHIGAITMKGSRHGFGCDEGAEQVEQVEMRRQFRESAANPSLTVCLAMR